MIDEAWIKQKRATGQWTGGEWDEIIRLIGLGIWARDIAIPTLSVIHEIPCEGSTCSQMMYQDEAAEALHKIPKANLTETKGKPDDDDHSKQCS